MRVLYFTHCAPPSFIDPHPLSPDQVICGPRCESAASNGRILSLTSPRGVFDASVIADQLPDRQLPEAVVAFVDAYCGCWPMNTLVFGCPRIALVGDVHHGKEPLSSVIEYLRAEAFDHVFICAARHNAKWFKAAGVTNVSYCGPTVLIRPFAGEFRRQRDPSIGFAGQLGQYHPRRVRMAQALKGAGLPFEPRLATQSEALELYSRSQLTFNCSLNGDVNMRVFEALSAGACLLTDRLSAQSGFPFVDGREVVCYGSPEELVDKARYFLGHPQEALAIAEAGYHAVLEKFRPEQGIAMVFDAVLEDRWHPSLSVEDVSLANNQDDRLAGRIRCYEALQELNRVLERVKVLYMDDVAEFASDAGELLRVEREFEGRSRGPWDRVVASAASRANAMSRAPEAHILVI